MDAKQLFDNINPGFAVGVMFMVLSIAWAAHTALRTRGMPMTREQHLEEQITEMRRDFTAQIKALQAQVAARDEQINILLDDRMHDRERIRVLEMSDAEKSRRIAELEREQEQLLNRSARGAKAAASYMPHKLSAEQLKELRTGLLDAYPTRDDWSALLSDIDHPLDLVALGDSLTVIANKVLTQAQASGWLEQLIAEAAEQRPELKALKELADRLLKVLGA